MIIQIILYAFSDKLSINIFEFGKFLRQRLVLSPPYQKVKGAFSMRPLRLCFLFVPFSLRAE